jgi:hypothetical protein
VPEKSRHPLSAEACLASYGVVTRHSLSTSPGMCVDGPHYVFLGRPFELGPTHTDTYFFVNAAMIKDSGCRLDHR